jgi:preprotein translocase SecE subunit
LIALANRPEYIGLKRSGVSLHQDNAEGRKVTRWFAAMRRFLAEIRLEINDVSWPAWREVRYTTIIVVSFLLALAAYVYVVDRMCFRLIDQMLLRQR